MCFSSDFLTVNGIVTRVSLSRWVDTVIYGPVFDGLGELIVFLFLVFVL